MLEWLLRVNCFTFELSQKYDQVDRALPQPSLTPMVEVAHQPARRYAPSGATAFTTQHLLMAATVRVWRGLPPTHITPTVGATSLFGSALHRYGFVFARVIHESFLSRDADFLPIAYLGIAPPNP